MARIKDLDAYNTNSFNNMKFKTINYETVLLSPFEVKEILIKYLEDELDFFLRWYNKRNKINIK